MTNNYTKHVDLRLTQEQYDLLGEMAVQRGFDGRATLVRTHLVSTLFLPANVNKLGVTPNSQPRAE